MASGICDIDKQQLATRVVIVRQGAREMELELCEFHYSQLRQQQAQSPDSDAVLDYSSEESFAGFASQLGYDQSQGTDSINLYEIVSDRSKEVIQKAAETTVRFGKREMGTEHLLHALAGSDEVRAVLKKMKLKGDDIQSEIETKARQTSRPVRRDEPIEVTVSPRIRPVMESAFRASRELGQQRIGPEHLLVGIVQEDEGIGGKFLRKHGLTPRTLRKKILHGANE